MPVDTRQRLAADSRIAKFNVGTELRMAFGEALRGSIRNQPDVFDRVKLLEPVIDPIKQATKKVISQLYHPLEVVE